MRDINKMEPDDSVYKVLLESTNAIPWKIDWQSKKFTYIGPQIESLLGWSASSWDSIEDWVERMHPDDRESVVNFCVAQSQAGCDHEADYRALTKNGGYIWIRDVVHVIRKNGKIESLIGFMFDISKRKQTEHKLLRLQKELEEFSFKDALTEIANRRMFDSIFEREWLSAQRNQHPVALILLDIDFFKEYNDHYGHIMGDDCLKQVAQILYNVAIRPGNFVARFGGEEFVLVLAETDEASAIAIAEECRSEIIKHAIPHEKSPISKTLSISAGISAIVPSGNSERKNFIQQVDTLLYQAKLTGRNRVTHKTTISNHEVTEPDRYYKQ
ncbi:MAG: sensor domain-containing diguanylate cyclase [Gammaproteobacteria bacterium]|nr:sensor domain-containing diguanylate cyclase [Gammaproteobacteria bacterium]